MIELTTAEYANADILVTTRDEVDGMPTLPFGHVLRHADDEVPQWAEEHAATWAS